VVYFVSHANTKLLAQGNPRACGLCHASELARRLLMEPRVVYSEAAPEGYKRMLALNAYVAGCGLEQSLLELVKVRASQINSCAFCIDMHWKDARAGGESEQRLYMLDAWREAPFYTDRERAALAWTEAVTLISAGGVSDATYQEARQHFTEAELVNLTYALVVINGWNRLSIGFQSVPGTYQPKAGRRPSGAGQ
jgi:AhpD family alkylhydroperoxidase